MCLDIKQSFPNGSCIYQIDNFYPMPLIVLNIVGHKYFIILSISMFDLENFWYLPDKALLIQCMDLK